MLKIEVNKEKFYTKTLRSGYPSNIFFKKWIFRKHEKI